MSTGALAKVHVALPIHDEVECLSSCIDALRGQDGVRLTVWCCVNQPDAWHDDPERRAVCAANQASLELLQGIDDLHVRIIDRSTRGNGWPPKRDGVGHARKTLMDAIAEAAGPEELIVSLDADTVTPEGYLQSMVAAFQRHPDACGVAARYFHPVTHDDAVTRAMLGYEIYMRYYVLNMWRIASPFAFTALGSAIALPVRVYRQLGGIKPRTSSEDFYFLQRLAKHGRLLHWTDVAVEPGTRKSWRVPVGTGQAIVAACEGKYADRYPLYPSELFDRVGGTTALFPALFTESVETPLDAFLRGKKRTDDLWQPLRDNHKTLGRFVRACHERLDGLRILQFMKEQYRSAPTDDTATLHAWLGEHGSRLTGFADDAQRWQATLARRPLAALETVELDALRRMLCAMEDGYRRSDDERSG